MMGHSLALKTTMKIMRNRSSFEYNNTFDNSTKIPNIFSHLNYIAYKVSNVTNDSLQKFTIRNK